MCYFRVCESCEVSSHCVQKFDLWRLPQVLIIHLKRFTVTGYVQWDTPQCLYTNTSFHLHLALCFKNAEVIMPRWAEPGGIW